MNNRIDKILSKYNKDLKNYLKDLKRYLKAGNNKNYLENVTKIYTYKDNEIEHNYKVMCYDTKISPHDMKICSIYFRNNTITPEIHFNENVKPPLLKIIYDLSIDLSAEHYSEISVRNHHEQRD